MRYTAIGLAALLLLAGCGSDKPPPTAPAPAGDVTFTVSGWVKTPHVQLHRTDLVPVEGAKVTLETNAGRQYSAVTDENGDYSFSYTVPATDCVKGPGPLSPHVISYCFKVEATGYVSYVRCPTEVSCQPGQGHTYGHFIELEQGP